MAFASPAQRRWYFATHPHVGKERFASDPSLRESTVIDSPDVVHGTYPDAAAAIRRDGVFRTGGDGTAGPAVYLTFEAKDALYQRRAGIAKVVAHAGAQPSVIVPAKVHGRVLDAGEFGRKGGPDVYVKPHVWAAMALETGAGRGDGFDMGSMTRDPNLAWRTINRHGFVGVAWKMADGRRVIAVGNPSHVSVVRHP